MDVINTILIGFTLLGVLALIVVLSWWQSREPPDRKIFHKMAMREIESLYQEVGEDLQNYQFFHTGHPDLWIQFTKEEFERKIISTCEGPYNPYLPRTSKAADINYRIDRQRKAIYLLPNSKTYSFERDRRLHKGDWEDSNKAKSEKIAKYKSGKV